VVLNGTDSDKNEHSTLSLCLLTHHGRATPLPWKTVQARAMLVRRERDVAGGVR
jgi:hypothetical protein